MTHNTFILLRKPRWPGIKTLCNHCIDQARDYVLVVALAIPTSWLELLYGGRSAPGG